MAENEPFSWLGGTPAPDGWEAVNRSGDTAEEADAKQADLLLAFEQAKLVHDVFAHGRGPELFERMRDLLVEKPVVRVAGSIGFADMDMSITPEQWLWIRAGQNSVFFWLRDLMDQARKGPPRVEAVEEKSDVE